MAKAFIFDYGDEPYFNWMDENPDGYVLNTHKRVKTPYFVLHKSNCSHITKYASFDDKAYTMRDFIKVASNDVYEIIQYCRENKNDFEERKIWLCKTCQPVYSRISHQDDLVEDEISYPDDLEDEKKYFEGAKKRITVNAYERDQKARNKCIEYFGCRCQCCEVNFEEVYGEIGRGFIHVHHLKSLSAIGEKYEVDPIKDLIPLCPNCHAMIHRRKEPYSLEELKEKLKDRKSR